MEPALCSMDTAVFLSPQLASPRLLQVASSALPHSRHEGAQCSPLCLAPLLRRKAPPPTFTLEPGDES
ncbi:Ephrin Type-A Receptor 5 [Manis pentadactyla]|nr:Ephrin Type-A Receptor 5 [Manis pentadactyla]